MLRDVGIERLRRSAICSAALLIIVAQQGGKALGQTNANATPTTGTASSASLPAPPGYIASGVSAIPSAILPKLSQGPSLAPAAVPGDALASMALRQNLAGQLKDSRKERVVPVPPTLEIEVLDPNVDPQGNPAVITTKDAAGGRKVDIPPVVLVHRYYYTGDRSFQGPMLPGGPSIIVVHHPRTGERLYIQTQMLPGAPRVYYKRSSIEYNYGPQAIILKFGHHGNPSVIYRQGTPLTEHWRQAREARRDRFDQWVQRTGIPQAYNRACEGASNAAGASADAIHGVGRMALTPVLQVMRSTPLGTIFTSDPAQQAQRERDTMVRRAEAEAKKVEGDISTIR